MAYGKYKDLTKRAQSDKVLRNKAVEIVSNPKYDRYQRWSAWISYMFFDKKSTGNDATMLANKSAIKSMSTINIYSSFKYNIWGVDLADMQLISKYNKGIRYLLCAIDLFSKYAWIAPLKDKKGITTVNAFPNIFDSSKREPNKIWVDQGSEFLKKNVNFQKMVKRQWHRNVFNIQWRRICSF